MKCQADHECENLNSKVHFSLSSLNELTHPRLHTYLHKLEYVHLRNEYLPNFPCKKIDLVNDYHLPTEVNK